MKRRSLLAAGLSATVAGALGSISKPVRAADAPAAGKFKLKYAPTLNAFEAHAGKDPVDQLKFIADQGFSAFFDNGLANKPAEVGEKIVKTAKELGLAIGPFVLSGPNGKPNWVLDTDEVRQAGLALFKKGIEDAKRLDVPQILVVPGFYPKDAQLSEEQMTANVIKNLKFVCEQVDFAGKTIVLEPLNHRNHPGMFLTGIKQGCEICKAVGNPAIKLVDDLYHQQISEGDLIPNIDAGWDYIAAFHLGDTPGRKEPLTGEINFRNVFKHIYDKGYQGVLCMEHGKSMKGKEGEQKLLAAYRWCDAFDQPIA